MLQNAGAADDYLRGNQNVSTNGIFLEYPKWRIFSSSHKYDPRSLRILEESIAFFFYW